MLAGTRGETRRLRDEARERRRALLERPFEELEEKARGVADAVGGGDGPSPVVKTAAAALAAALAGGRAGAAKALVERRREDDEDEDEPQAEAGERSDEEEDDESAPEAEAEATDEGVERDEPDGEEPEEQPEDESDEEEPEAEAEPQQPEDESDEEEAEAQEAESRDDRQDDEQRDEDGDGRREGASRGDVAEVVKAARTGMERLLGHEVESVSGFERGEDGWRVTLEVVDVRRVPDSTDVLSSYCVLLDDDRNLVRLDRTRRYRRCEVDGE